MRLVDMGFPTAQASAALAEHPGNPEAALMWLLNRAHRAKEARQAKIVAAAAAAGQQQRDKAPVAGRSFKAVCGPVPRSPSVMHASPEPSRANRPCVMEQQHQPLASLPQPKLERAADENSDPQQRASKPQDSAVVGDDGALQHKCDG